jgi:hypothetical protein
MDSTLKPKPTDDPRDDPHDVLEVAPGVALVAPNDEELSKLLRAAARQHSDPQAHRSEPQFDIVSDASAGPTVPPVDTTFRATAVNNGRVRGSRASLGARAMRAFKGFLLAVVLGVAAAAWQAYGDAAGQVIANWTPQRVLTSLLPPENSGLNSKPAEQANPPAVQESAATAAAAQPSPPAQTAREGVAPTAAESAPSLASMARDLANAGQEIAQLKASIEQLKANQEQMSRDLAKASEAKAAEQTPRPKISAVSPPPPRPATAMARRPMPAAPTFRPAQAAAAPMLPPAAAPYPPPAAPYPPPRQLEPPPLAAAPPPVPVDPELTIVPRPPMPVQQTY